jgi:hypothetical protein
MNRLDCNGLRFIANSPAGHYESYFQRANHPVRPLALWIRYTVFSPKGRPDQAQGELWAMWFDGEKKRVRKAYRALPWAQCAGAPGPLRMRIGDASLSDSALQGGTGAISWDLQYTSPEQPLLLFPEAFYERALPKAKVLVGSPHARYSGTFTVDGETHDICDWPGSQNHNWGSKHTDLYAWGQVSGFDNEPEAFLEVATARVKLGPWLTPALTPIVLRLGGEEHQLNTPSHLWSAHGAFKDFEWHFEGHDERIRVKGKMTAPAWAFAPLDYRNPPGGVKLCLNSKIARCEATVTFANGTRHDLHSAHRAAFELLGDRDKLAALGCSL